MNLQQEFSQEQKQRLVELLDGSDMALNASPAHSITIVNGFDNDGWEEWLTLTVGNIVVSEMGRMYKIIGFTTKNTIICVQYGLDIDPAILHLEFTTGMGLKHALLPEYEYRHKDSLI